MLVPRADNTRRNVCANRVRSEARVLCSALVVALLVIGVYFAEPKVESKPAPARSFAVHGARVVRGNLSSVDVQYKGSSQFVEQLQTGNARPLSLATADFNLDGAPDLVTGYENFITVEFGNIEAFAPSSPEVYAAIHRGEVPSSFAGPVQTIAVPGRVDFLAAGDFSLNGFKDVLVATKEGALYLLEGRLNGGFELPQAIPLSGGVTALAVGKFNLGGSVSDVAIGISGPAGPSVMIFDDEAGGIRGIPSRYPLRSEATSLVLESLDEDVNFDVAAVVGSEIQIVHGPGRNPTNNRGSRVETIPVGFNSQSIAVAELAWDRGNRRELALVTADGSVQVLQQRGRNTKPYSDAELARLKWERENIEYRSEDRNRENEPAWQPSSKATLEIAGQLIGARASAGFLVASNVGSRQTADLILPDSQRLNVVYGSGDLLSSSKNGTALSVEAQPDASVEIAGEPIAILEMPRKVDGSRDVITITEGSAQKDVIKILAATFPVVDTTVDDPTLNACTGALNDCSLRGAIEVFAVNPDNIPATITIPAGTYNLTHANGDINVDGDGTTLVGAGAASTVIDQELAGNHRIFFVDVTAPFENFDFALSGLTVRDGHRTSSSGGAMLVGGNNSTTMITNCIFQNNSVDIPPGGLFGNGGAVFHGLGASGDTGDLTMIACTFLNNTSENVGGGLQFDGGTGTPTATIRNCVFDNNQSQINDGGAMNLTAAGTSGSFEVTQSTFINNEALGSVDSDGGAINKGNGTLNAFFNRFFQNSTNSGGLGDSAFRAAGNNSVNISNNWWGCNGDPSSPATGCDKVEQAVVGGTFTLNPRLQLTQTATPPEICINTMTTLTGSFLVDSDGGAVSASNLYVFTGVPPVSPSGVPARTPLSILFDNPVLGSLSMAQTQIQSTGTATAVFTAGATGGNGSARVTVDNAMVTTTIPIAQPTIAGATIGRQQGSPVSNSQIATAADTISDPMLTVSVNAMASATVNGVTVSNIAVDVMGNVTADVIASCTATNAMFTLVVTDRLGCVSSSSTLTVNVTPNTPPTLGAYPNTGPIAINGGTTVTPNAAPTDNGTVDTLTATSPTFTGTLTGNPMTGVVTVTNAAPSGTHTVTVTATDNCGAMTTTTFDLIVNTPPEITAAMGLSRQQGSPASNSQIATVSDINQAANTLAVTVDSGATSTVNGVTVNNIAVDASGNVTADIIADCTATNASFTLTVTDDQAATDTDTLQVNVTVNTPPTLGNYPNTGPVALNGSSMVTPDAAPTDNGSISTLTATAPGFTGTLTGNTTTGVISVTNAAPAGTFTVTVTATDNCGSTSMTTFELVVNTAPVITAAGPLSRQQGSPSSNSQIATVSDINQAANTLAVTVDGGASATVNGVTVSNIAIDGSGNVTADVVASCTATNASFTLTATDTQSATDTDTLQVDVTANTPPTLGNYPNTVAAPGSNPMITPDAAPADNGGVVSLTASAPMFGGSFSGNPATGVITVTNASPEGMYTVTVEATDNCGATTTTMFTLTVQALTPDVVVHDATVAEPPSGSTNMLFTVALSTPASGTVTVDFTTATGGANPATAGADFTTTSGTVTFMAGEQLKTIAVPVLNDADNGETDETFLLNLTGAMGANITDNQATGTITVASQSGTFLISETRTSGPAGLGDDFVELYNNSNLPLTVMASDASAGYGLFKMGATCDATPELIGTIPNGTVIPARGHFLFVGSQYSLADYGGTGAAAGDNTLSSDIESDFNVAIFSTANVANASSLNRLDAVGFGTNTGGNCDLLREPTNLPAVSGSVLEHSFQRDQCGKLGNPAAFGPCSTGGIPKDSNNNAADFFFADTTGTATAAGQRLGAPGPENLGNPRLFNSLFPALLLDSTIAASLAPNRVRDLTPDPMNNATNGTLSVRRRFRNDTGGPVTRLRFRIIDISTFPTSAGIADVRALSSMDVVVNGINDSQTCAATGTPVTPPCQITVRGTVLEQPPGQGLGAGLNSTLTVTLGTPLDSGESINIQWLLGVQQSGSFKFFINVEALDSAPLSPQIQSTTVPAGKKKTGIRTPALP